MNNISKSVLNKIKKGNIQPKSRLYFILIHLALWSAAIFSVILGGLAVAVILRHFLLTDWVIVRHISGGSWHSFVAVLPYLWFLLMGLTFFLAKYLLAHTKKAYKVKPIYITIASILLSVVVGSLFFATKLDVPVESGLQRHVRPYAALQQRREQLLVSPDRGVLAGKIIAIDMKEELMIIDLRGQQWTVDIRDAQIRRDVILEEGGMIGVIGKKESDNFFRAKEVRQFKRDVKRRQIQTGRMNRM